MNAKNAVTCALLGVALVACNPSHALEPTYDPQTGTYAVEFTGDGNLIQRVVLSSSSPAKGSVLNVTSIVYNYGVKRDVTLRTCGLDFSGLLLVDNAVHCNAYSVKATMAPNDSIAQSDIRTVAANAGDYTLKVRHLLDPERWVQLKLHVK